jgi:hypothetical protein
MSYIYYNIVSLKLIKAKEKKHILAYYSCYINLVHTYIAVWKYKNRSIKIMKAENYKTSNIQEMKSLP